MKIYMVSLFHRATIKNVVLRWCLCTEHHFCEYECVNLLVKISFRPFPRGRRIGCFHQTHSARIDVTDIVWVYLFLFLVSLPCFYTCHAYAWMSFLSLTIVITRCMLILSSIHPVTPKDRGIAPSRRVSDVSTRNYFTRLTGLVSK